MSSNGTVSFTSPSLSGSGSTSASLPVTTSSPPITTSESSSVAQLTTTTAPPTTAVITSVITASSAGGNSQTTVIIIATTAGSTITQNVPPSSSSSAAAASSTTAGFNTTTTNQSTNPPPNAGTIAAAVVVPVVVVALLIVAGLFFWKKRKQRKEAEEARKKEMEEYNYNPNNDPTIPAASSGSGDGGDKSGYRGWGTTSSNTRKASTTLSSGLAKSDDGGYPSRGQYSPNGPSENHSGDPLMDNNGQAEPVGALGAAPVSSNRGNGVNRGPSNASSAYSGGANRSDTSGEGPPMHVGSPQYYNDLLYQEGGMPHDHADGSWGGQPVIKDVSARRNTTIENPSVLPQQGNSGISQNF